MLPKNGSSLTSKLYFMHTAIIIGSKRRMYFWVSKVNSACAYLIFIFSVIGTLEAPDYGLFVSHSHPDGQVCLFQLDSVFITLNSFPIRHTSTSTRPQNPDKRGGHSPPIPIFLRILVVPYTTKRSLETPFRRARFPLLAESPGGILFSLLD